MEFKDSKKPPNFMRKIGVLTALIPIFFIVIALGVAIGSVYIPIDRVIHVIISNTGTPMEKMIILSSRLPRVLGAAVGGAAIACAGLLLQVYFKNFIVDPYILGVSSGAAFFVAIELLLGIYMLPHGLMYPLLVTGAFIGAMLTTLLIVIVAGVVKSSVTLLLIGIMVSYIFRAAIDVMVSVAETARVHAFALWSLGSFVNLTWTQLQVMIVAFPMIFLSCMYSKQLNALLLGEEHAQTIGLNIKRARFTIITLAALLVAVIVAFTGPISFIGLAVPHIARLILKTSNNRFLIPGTALLGGIVTVLCDLVARTLIAPAELPISAVTSFFGAPLVIFLLLRMKAYERV